MNKESSELAIIMCEAWCDRKLYYGHWFGGRPETSKDLNVLSRLPLPPDIFDGTFKILTDMAFKITPEEKDRYLFYHIADGIYPNWHTFVKPMYAAQKPEERRYSQSEETVRKDVESMYGVRKSHFEIIRREMLYWDLKAIIWISTTCIILYSLIIRMQ